MIIVGSGAIGVEFAYFYNAMGTEVTIVEFLPNLVPLEDEEVSKQFERSLKKSKIKVMTNSSVTRGRYFRKRSCGHGIDPKGRGQS